MLGSLEGDEANGVDGGGAGSGRGSAVGDVGHGSGAEPPSGGEGIVALAGIIDGVIRDLEEADNEGSG